MNLEPGRTIAHYRLLEKLGEGGMGVVWKARDLKLDRDIAIKFLPEDLGSDPDRRAYFEREAKAVAQGLTQKGWYEHDSNLDALRSQPRFQALLDKL